jgi:hypothetical protein
VVLAEASRWVPVVRSEKEIKKSWLALDLGFDLKTSRRKQRNQPAGLKRIHSKV